MFVQNAKTIVSAQLYFQILADTYKLVLSRKRSFYTTVYKSHYMPIRMLFVQYYILVFLCCSFSLKSNLILGSLTCCTSDDTQQWCQCTDTSWVHFCNTAARWDVKRFLASVRLLFNGDKSAFSQFIIIENMSMFYGSNHNHNWCKLTITSFWLNFNDIIILNLAAAAAT